MSDIQQSIFDYLRQPFKIDKPIRLITLFSGYDSQAMALRRLGVDFEHYRAVESNKYAINSLNAVHGTHFEPADIRDVKGADLGIVDKDKYTYLLTYSYPCTSISLAGKQEGMDRESGTASSLIWEVERLLKECNELGNLPDVLQMENVTECHNYKHQANFDEWTRFLESLGYTNYLADLNASDFLIPQHRERAIMFSFLGEYNYKFPEPVALETCMEDYLEDESDESLYVKSEKAYDLILKLVDNGTLSKDNPDRTEQNRTEQNRTEQRFYLSEITTESCDKDTQVACTSQVESAHLSGQEITKNRYRLSVRVIGRMDHTIDNTFESANRVYDTKGLSPTLPTGCGGGHIPKVIVKKARYE